MSSAAEVLARHGICVVIEQQTDNYDPDTYFVMKSYYYSCQTVGDSHGQYLDAYEEELNFQPEFIKLEDVYTINAKMLTQGNGELNGWVERETRALERLSGGNGNL